MLPTHIYSLYFIFVIFITGPQPNKIWLVNAQQDISPPSQHSGKTFMWKPSVKLHDRDNWLNGDIACDGDRLQLDRNNNLVTLMVEQNVKADMIGLPSDGVVFFGAEKVVLGGAGRWQCNKRKSSEGCLLDYLRQLKISFVCRLLCVA
uniref:Protein amnionless n=1 Tax=Ditylenchus dipsaci TaxID=166011 RepID=A0A915EMJ4_9BILA